MTLTRKASDYFKLIRDRGLMSVALSCWHRFYEQAYERHLGIRSGDIISLKELGVEHEDRREHFPTQLRDFRSMEQFLRPETSDDVFIDYGSGLGRIVILASLLPFRRVIGIEISPELVSRARANLARCRDKLRCQNVEIINIDAMTFDVPDDATIFYFNNPFAGDILKVVLTKIQESYRRKARTMRLICYLPSASAFETQICQVDLFQLRHRLILADRRKCLVFYVRKQEHID
jgi:hypothetical protein